MTHEEFYTLRDESKRLMDEAIRICSNAGVVPENNKTLRELGWRIKFQKYNGGAWGWCKPLERMVLIRVCASMLYSDALDCLQHEFAHAVQKEFYPYSAPHGVEWKNCAVALGCRPESRRAATPEEKAERLDICPWVLRHKTTGKVYRGFSRRPRRTDWSRMCLRNRREETFGQLEVVPNPKIGGSLAPASNAPATAASVAMSALFLVTGNTFPLRQTFGAAGLVWDSSRRGWKGPMEKIAALGDIPGCTVVRY